MLKFFNSLPFFQERTGRQGLSNYETFLRQFPEYNSTKNLDAIRIRDFARLDEQIHTYLDFTGGHLVPQSLLDAHHRFLSNSILGNPHSINPSSALSQKHIQATRNKVLSFFNAGDDYECIFTQNASAAIKIIGECYPFEDNGQLLMTFDNHNSINGLREFARAKAAPFAYSPLNDELRINNSDLKEKLATITGQHKLFAFPAQSNVSGVKHNLEWIEEAQSLGWDVLLDAAAFVPSERLDLLQHQPEFVSLSFYKMFGYPTGLGALLVKKSAYAKLAKPSFAGGTITIVSVQGDGHHLEKGPARFEEGTLNYINIPAIKMGLEYLEAMDMEKVKARVNSLTAWLLQQLRNLRHRNGQRLVTIYGPQDTQSRGGTIAMNFFDQQGRMYDFIDIEKAAYKENISLRTGCFCNPGIDETNHQLKAGKLQDYFQQTGEKDYFDLIQFIDQKRGAVRVSLGYMSNFEDVERFLKFCRSFLSWKKSNQFNRSQTTLT